MRSILDYGDVSADATLAWEAALADASLAVLTVPRGVYRIARTLRIARTMTIQGESGPRPRGMATDSVLRFAPGIGGLVLTRDSVGRGDRCRIAGLYLYSDDARLTPGAHGIEVHSSGLDLDCVSVEGFGGDGVRFEASTLTVHAPANCNHFRLGQLGLYRNGGNGLTLLGADCNAGLAQCVDASGNLGWGILEDGTLGNTFAACHTAANGSASAGGDGGAYSIGGPSSYSVVLGCYSESGQHPSRLGQRAISIGGDHGAGWALDSHGTVLSSDGPGLRLTRLDGLPLAAGNDPTLRMCAGSHAPTMGTWRRGERVLNSLPAPGQSLEWVCIQGGTPGTWRAGPVL